MTESAIKEYYGSRIGGCSKTAVCPAPDGPLTPCLRQKEKLPDYITEALASLSDEVKARAFGCATDYPEAMEGKRVLDLGSGSGRDCFVMSRVVGENGNVVGLDMTQSILDFSNSNIDYHIKKYGYEKSNVSFVHGFMEDLKTPGLKENSYDAIISNCVICLSKDKKQVLREAARVLKPGGEFHFSDMYREGDLPPGVETDDRLWCEGLTGSLTYQELNSVAEEAGFTVPRVIKARSLPIVVEEIKQRLSGVRHASVTYRLFKKSPDHKNSVAEATYKGGILGFEDNFKFDHNYTFTKGEKKLVDEELAQILTTSRFAPYFDVTSTDTKADLPSPVIDPFSIL